MIDYGDNKDWSWVGGLEEIHFTVREDGKNILCRVSREFLEDHCGNPSDPVACLDAAKGLFDPITDKIGRLISGRRFEPDGSVLLRTSDG